MRIRSGFQVEAVALRIEVGVAVQGKAAGKPKPVFKIVQTLSGLLQAGFESFVYSTRRNGKTG